MDSTVIAYAPKMRGQVGTYDGVQVGEIVRLKAGAAGMIVEAADEKAPKLSALGSPTSFLGAALQVAYIAEG